jgi:UDP-3-O-acyl-N-acetylglucosamine deacetylase
MNITLNGKTCFTLGSASVLISEHTKLGIHIKINTQIHALQNLQDHQITSERYTALHLEDDQAQQHTLLMIEHLLAGLVPFVGSQTGLLLEIKKVPSEVSNNKALEVESPMFDGSAKVVYNEIIKAKNPPENNENCNCFEIPNNDLSTLSVDNKYGIIELQASPNFEIEYTWNSKGLEQTFQLKSLEQYSSEVIPARTFIHKDDYDAIVKMGGLAGAEEGQGIIWSVSEASSDLNPQIILHSGGALRFKNEFVRHKVLDLMGDLMLLGGQLPRVKLIVKNSGHALNQELVKKLRKYVIS